jgi:hypothetical protein
VEFVSTGAVQKPVPIGSVITCIACHNEAAIALNSVQMPSGAKISGLGPEARCMQCHQGRESTVSVNKLLAGLEDDTVSDKIKFVNVHYFAAGATLFGTQAKGAYEYEGKTYNGRLKHVEPVNTCVKCHDVHALNVKVEVCGGCHQGVKTVEDLENIRMVKVDYTGGGNPGEGLAKSIDTLRGKLYAAIQDYAKTIAGKPTVYSADNYPYFFTDLNGNGQPDPDEIVAENGYTTWTPRLLRAAYNLQYVTKDPGAFAHNGRYIVQILQDSLESLGKKVKVDMTGMVRPEVTP